MKNVLMAKLMATERNIIHSDGPCHHLPAMPTPAIVTLCVCHYRTEEGRATTENEQKWHVSQYLFIMNNGFIFQVLAWNSKSAPPSAHAHFRSVYLSSKMHPYGIHLISFYYVRYRNLIFLVYSTFLGRTLLSLLWGYKFIRADRPTMQFARCLGWLH